MGSVLRLWPRSVLWLSLLSSLFVWLWGASRRSRCWVNFFLLFFIRTYSSSRGGGLKLLRHQHVPLGKFFVILISGGARTPRTSTRPNGVVLHRVSPPPHPVRSPSIHVSHMPRWRLPLLPWIGRLLDPPPSPSTASLSCRSRRRLIILLHRI